MEGEVKMGEGNVVKVIDLLIEKISMLEWQLERAADEKKLLEHRIKVYEDYMNAQSAEVKPDEQSEDL